MTEQVVDLSMQLAQQQSARQIAAFASIASTAGISAVWGIKQHPNIWSLTLRRLDLRWSIKHAPNQIFTLCSLVGRTHCIPWQLQLMLGLMMVGSKQTQSDDSVR